MRTEAVPSFCSGPAVRLEDGALSGFFRSIRQIVVPTVADASQGALMPTSGTEISQESHGSRATEAQADLIVT